MHDSCDLGVDRVIGLVVNHVLLSGMTIILVHNMLFVLILWG